MGAWSKLFSNASLVTSTVNVKGADGVTRSARLNVGATSLTDDAFADAARMGATLSESIKTTNAAGETVQKKNTIKSDDITGAQAGAAVRELLAVPEPAPKKNTPAKEGATA